MTKQSYTFALFFAFSIFSLLGCNSTQTAQSVAMPELIDDAFPRYNETAIMPEQQIFAMDKAMTKFVDKHTSRAETDKEKLSDLVTAIFKQTELSMSYRAGANTGAIETFHSGKANCLSLTVMTYSMTQYLGMHSEFQDIQIPEFWTRRNGKTLINSHINLKVQAREQANVLFNDSTYTIDFNPQENIKSWFASRVSKSQMVSFFYSNIAADYLIDDQASPAYAYLRAAVLHDPNNEGAWLNLGVLASQNKLYDAAESYYQMAISLRPAFASAYENLAILYERQGKNKKAANLLKDLHKTRLRNPYYHMVNGDIAMENKAYDDAISHYKDAIKINHSPHEFHFKLAKAYYRNGNMEKSQRYLERAKQRAKNDMLIERYSSKLSSLVAKR